MNPLRKARFSRRHLLRSSVAGVGAAIALPPLEAMFSSDTAYAQGAGGKPRFLAIYQPNGHHREKYHPMGSGRALNFGGQAAAPLEPVMADVTLIQNLATCATGAEGNSHLCGITSWLAGAAVKSSSDLTHKMSLDTAIAEYYQTKFPTGRSQHLVLAGSPFLDPGRMAYNNEQKDWISTAKNGEKIFAQIDVEGVFTRLMTGQQGTPATPAEPVDTKVLDARLATRKSVLDYVNTSITALDARLGASDKAAVDGYLTSIREIEGRLSVAPGGGGAPVACDAAGVAFKRKWPSERAPDLANEYIDEHWQDTMRVLQVAFQCEAVRSVAYMLETEAGESGYANHNLPNSHGCAHGTNQQYSDRDRVHATLFAEMVNLFKGTALGTGTLLDQTMILFGMGQGVNHSYDQTTAILAGFTGSGTHLPKIKHGAMVDYNNAKNMSAVIRSIGLHFDAITPAEGYGDAGPSDKVDLDA